MKKILSFALAFALAACGVTPPANMVDHKPVQVERSFLSTKYRQDGALLQPMSMVPVLENYPDAKGPAHTGRAFYYTGMVFGAAGGVMLGYPVGYALSGQEFNAPLFFTGVGVAAVGIVFGALADSKLAHAAETYNAALAKTGMRLDVGPAGLAVSF